MSPPGCAATKAGISSTPGARCAIRIMSASDANCATLSRARRPSSTRHALCSGSAASTFPNPPPGDKKRSAAAHPVDASGGRPSRAARREEYAMRPILIAVAATFFIAAPAAAQPERMSDKIQDYAPAIDRSADALLNLDLGPILDAADPYRAHHRRTLRD